MSAIFDIPSFEYRGHLLKKTASSLIREII